MVQSSTTQFTGEEVLDIAMDDDEEILNEFCFHEESISISLTFDKQHYNHVLYSDERDELCDVEESLKNIR